MQLAGLIDEGLARPGGGRSIAPEARPGADGDARSSATWKKSEILEAYLNLGAVPRRDRRHRRRSRRRSSASTRAASTRTRPRSRRARARAERQAADVAERACGVLELQRLDCIGVRAWPSAALSRRRRHAARRAARAALRAAGDRSARRERCRRARSTPRLQRLAVTRCAASSPSSPAATSRTAPSSSRQRDGRSARLGRLSGELSARRRGRRRAGPAPAGLDPEAVRLRSSPSRSACSRRPRSSTTRRRRSPPPRALPAAELRPRVEGLSAPAPPSARASTCRRCGRRRCSGRRAAQRLDALGLRSCRESAGCYGASLALGSADVSLLAADQRLPHARQRRRLALACSCRRGGGRRRPVRVADAPPRSSSPTSSPTTTPRAAPSASPARWRRAASARGQDRHQQGHARQLVRRLHRPLHDRRLGRQRRRRGDARRQRRQRRGAGLAGARRLPARRRTVEGRRRRPAGVVAPRIAFDCGSASRRATKYFLAGSERALQRATGEVRAAERYGITSPRDGSVFAIDPDIPPAAQRITFEGEHGTWVLDGRPDRRRRAAPLGALAGAASPRCSSATSGRDAAERRLRGARCRRQEPCIRPASRRCVRSNRSVGNANRSH